MGYTNNIVFEDRCPACGNIRTILAQTRTASNIRYEGVDYRFGEKMEWWPKRDVDHGKWIDEADRVLANGNIGEACHAWCQTCGAELCAVIEFEAVRPLRCLQLVRNADWPEDYPR